MGVGLSMEESPKDCVQRGALEAVVRRRPLIVAVAVSAAGVVGCAAAGVVGARSYGQGWRTASAAMRALSDSLLRV